MNPPKQYTKHIVNQQVASESDPEYRVCVNTTCANDPQLTDQFMPIYDVNYAGVEEKFVNSIMHFNQFSDHIDIADSQSHTFQLWREQSDFDFGFIPLGEQQMPNTFETNVIDTNNLIEIHEIVRRTKKPNFMQARIPVTSQLNVEVWQELLKDYWDQQLLLRFGFPLDLEMGSYTVKGVITPQLHSTQKMLMLIYRRKLVMVPYWDLSKKIQSKTHTPHLL